MDKIAEFAPCGSWNGIAEQAPSSGGSLPSVRHLTHHSYTQAESIIQHAAGKNKREFRRSLRNGD